MLGSAASIICAASLSSTLAESQNLGLYIDRKPTANEASKNYTSAKYEPRFGCYLGAFIDLDSSNESTYLDRVGKTRRLPNPFETATGKIHATYFYYMGYGSRLAYDWISKLGNEGKIVHIALEPNNGLEYVRDDNYLRELAEGLAATNVPIFIRFASEMNGPWVKYHGNPKLYKEKFRLVSQTMKKYAPNVAMVWCPYTTPSSQIKPYYPGDDVVDWVGVNMYSVTYFDQDPKKPAKQIHPVEMLDYVYETYSAKKPIMIGEYGATHWSALEQKSTRGFAQKTIQALYTALPRKYPRVKCINYFNGNNLELDHRKNNNYAVTQDAPTLKTYKSVIEDPFYLSYVADTNGFPQSNPYAIPVSGNAPTGLDLLPIMPLPAQNKQVVSGPVMFSGWYKDHSGNTSLRFKIDGATFHFGETKDNWKVEVDTTRVKNGPHTIDLLAQRDGKTIASKSIQIIVQN